jgi:zinc and cadmium transporter
VAQTLLYVFASVALVSALALAGVVFLALGRDRVTHLLPGLVAFAAGTLFGDAFIHILPEVVANDGFGPGTGLTVLGGIVFAFLVERLVWHHHHVVEDDEHAGLRSMIIFGDAVHNFIDGAILAASFLVSIPLGVATTLAVALHEVPQELGDFGVLVYGGFSRRRALAFNLLTALTAFAGAGLVLALGSGVGLVPVLLPIVAGNFIYIAGSDLLPEMREETGRQAAVQLVLFGAGIALMYALALAE